MTIPFGIAEAKGTEPSTLSSGRMFHIAIGDDVDNSFSKTPVSPGQKYDRV
jgi:hypothetical protein